MVVDDDVAVLATQDRVASDEHPVTDADAFVVGAFGIQATTIVDHDVVTNPNLVRVTQYDVDPETHVASAPAKKQGIEL